jgi:hypothetical protein
MLNYDYESYIIWNMPMYMEVHKLKKKWSISMDAPLKLYQTSIQYTT